jgi:hypothetical protein
VNRERAAVAQPAIAADLDQALDVQLYLAPQVAFDGIAPTEDIPDLGDFSFAEVFHPDIRIDAGLIQYLERLGSADAINIGKAYLDSFITG